MLQIVYVVLLVGIITGLAVNASMIKRLITSLDRYTVGMQHWCEILTKWDGRHSGEGR